MLWHFLTCVLNVLVVALAGVRYLYVFKVNKPHMQHGFFLYFTISTLTLNFRNQQSKCYVKNLKLQPLAALPLVSLLSFYQ